MSRTGALISGPCGADRDTMSTRLRAAACITAVVAATWWGTAAASAPPSTAPSGTNPSTVPGSPAPATVPGGNTRPPVETIPMELPDGVRGADLAEPAIIALQSEILVLIELGALADPVPPRLEQIHATDESFVQDLSRDSLLVWLADAEADGIAALNAIVTAGVTPTPALDIVLRPLDPSNMEALRAGRQITVPSGEYAVALNNLDQLAREIAFGPGMGSAPPGANPTGTITPGTIAPSTTIAGGSVTPSGQVVSTVTAPAGSGPAGSSAASEPLTQTAEADEPSGDGESSGPWLAIGAAIGVLGLAMLVVVLSGRRRRPSDRNSNLRLDEVLDAGRRVGTCLEPQAARRAAVREAIGLTGADAAALFEVGPNGLQTVVQQPSMFVPPYASGLPQRVASTGQPTRLVGTDVSLAPTEARAILVTAVAADGKVSGVVAVVRSADRPFSEGDQDRLSHLAPFIATALEASSQHSQVTEQSMTDALTNLANRRRLDRDLGDALATRGGTVAFAMIDIDHFKTYNDTHGHPAGDDVLRQVAEILRLNVRPNDVVYRYGGEEFCILLPDCTTEEATVVAERLRRAVHDAEFPGATTQPDGRLTVSVGVALAAQPDAAELKNRADGALYDAKRAGRDRVVIAGPPAD